MRERGTVAWASVRLLRERGARLAARSAARRCVAAIRRRARRSRRSPRPTRTLCFLYDAARWIFAGHSPAPELALFLAAYFAGRARARSANRQPRALAADRDRGIGAARAVLGRGELAAQQRLPDRQLIVLPAALISLYARRTAVRLAWTPEPHANNRRATSKRKSR
jgi:hypothetical protein